MMKAAVLLAAFLNVSVVNAVFQPPHKLPGEEGGAPPVAGLTPATGGGRGTTPRSLNGNLGALEDGALAHLGTDDTIVKAAAEDALMSVLRDYLYATGNEVVQATPHKIPADDDGNLHVRFRQYIHGHPIEGATMMVHINGKDGTIYKFNGEFCPTPTIDKRVNLQCEAAMEIALSQSGIEGGVWLDDCQEAAVYGFDRLGHLAYKRLVGYQPDGEAYQRTLVFASTGNGALLALHPQTKSGKSLETWDCKKSDGNLCRVITNSSSRLTSGNPGVVRAHNYASDTYDFYITEYGRDSVDDLGMTIRSIANSGTDNNAWWNGVEVTYGGGDGITYFPFSFGLDVVAHEITHGVTEFTSNLVYSGESGALNEAMSDIFGAVVERLTLHKSVNDTWLVGEDIFIHGGAIRNMQDPAAYDCVDYYPDVDDYYYYYNNAVDEAAGLPRYEVHNFSAIANLAFALMVQGGKHPRNKTSVVVPAINSSDFDASLKAAAKIFYMANTQCLTEGSDYSGAFDCTMEHAGEHNASVRAAWAAVGLVEEFVPFNGTELQDGVKVTGQAGYWNDVREYYLGGVLANETVTCITEGDNGDADMFLRLHARAVANVNSYSNDCSSGSYGSNEACTTMVSTKSTKAYTAVYAYDEFSDLSVRCFRAPVENLELGALMTLPQGAGGVAKYFAVDLSDFYLGDGDMVQCATFATNGDADLFVKYGTLPSPFDDDGNACESMTVGSSTESCTAYYSFTGVISSQAFLAVYSSQNYQDLKLQCHKFNSLDNLYPGESRYLDVYWDLHPGAISQFELVDGVKKGESLTCSLTQESSSTSSDLDLFVRFGQLAEPFDWSTANACSSVGPTASESCTTLPAGNNNTAYVAIRTNPLNDGDSYYYYYNEVKLLCTVNPPCLNQGAVCTSTNQCCNAPVFTCDGPPGGARTCKKCLAVQKQCTRSTQCCSGLCKNKKCQKKKKSNP